MAFPIMSLIEKGNATLPGVIHMAMVADEMKHRVCGV
jgi:hypothetical protein